MQPMVGFVMSTSPILIGLAGGSGSGKTHLAKQIQLMAGEEYVSVLSMDQYFKSDASGDPRSVNFDHPSHLDLDLMIEYIGALRNGEPVRVPSYDFRTMRQTREAWVIEPITVVVVEGLFVLAEPIVGLLDFTCFLDVADDQRLLGRILRDSAERDSTIEHIVDRYQRFVRPSYSVFVAPTRQNADVVVDFTYRRALFTRLLVHIVQDYSRGYLDLGALSKELRAETYSLGYRSDQSIMPASVDIRRLGLAYPDAMLPTAASRDPDGAMDLYISADPEA